METERKATVNLFDPARTALVLIDMQGAVFAHAAEPVPADEVLAQVTRLVDAARKAGSLVVFVRTSFLPDESDSLAVRAIDQVRGAPHRFDGWDRIVDELAPRPTEPIVVKRSWNAFHGSDLDLQLRRHNVDTFVIAGISTNWGVEGTARAGYEHNYNIVFAEGAMASNTAANHDFAVSTVFPQLGRVRSVDDIVAAFGA